MITWLRLWPLLLVPFVLMVLVGLLPEVTLGKATLGGPQFREGVFNVMLSLFTWDARTQLVDWYHATNTWGELGAHALIGLNVNAALLPLLYGIGSAVVRFSAWASRADLNLKRQQLR